MTLLASSTHIVTSSAKGLERIRDPECSLAVWERAAPDFAKDAVAQLKGNLRFPAKLSEIERTAQSQLEAAGMETEATRTALASDIAMLAGHYCQALSLDAVELRLEIVTGDSCRKFHADYVSARLITTYCGTGTQWIDDADAQRVRNGQEPSQINTLKAGDVGLFKGKLATENPAIHRSPPISGTGETRLLLVLNPPENA